MVWLMRMKCVYYGSTSYHPPWCNLDFGHDAEAVCRGSGQPSADHCCINKYQINTVFWCLIRVNGYLLIRLGMILNPIKKGRRNNLMKVVFWTYSLHFWYHTDCHAGVLKYSSIFNILWLSIKSLVSAPNITTYRHTYNLHSIWIDGVECSANLPLLKLVVRSDDLAHEVAN